MSLLDVWIQPSCALVGVDTEARYPNDVIETVSKMLPLVHMNAVIAGTGSHLFCNNLFSGCHSVGLDLDGLIEKMPELLPLVHQAFLQSLEQGGIRIRENPNEQSAVLVGWSNSEGRMIGRYYVQVDAAEGFTESKIEPGIIQPGTDDRWADRLRALPLPSTPADMGRFAQEQTRIIKEFVAEIHAGGKFIVAEITRDRMTIAPVCGLG